MSRHLLKILALVSQLPLTLNAHTVTSAASSGPGTLAQAILDANISPAGGIDCSPIAGQTITLTQPLPAITDTYTINGANVTINGNNLFQGLSVADGSPTINQIQFSQTVSQGGAGGHSGPLGGGGGGGIGGGGGLYVHTGTIVTTSNVNYTTCQAKGGNGGNSSAVLVGIPNGGGGGGGFGGGGGGSVDDMNVADIDGGGGGGGHPGGGVGGTAIVTAGNAFDYGGGVSTSGAGGGAATKTGGNSNGHTGGTTGGGGAGAGGNGANGSGGVGGIGIGSDMLFGGGGGGGSSIGAAGAGRGAGGGAGGGALGSAGGAGGTIGGGGGGSADADGAGGAGGFGGGGGGGPMAGAGGTFGGNGGAEANGTGGGGGGGAIGGAIFVDQGATLNLTDSSFSGSALTAGIAGMNGFGGTPGTNGSTVGYDIFLKSGGTAPVLNATYNNSVSIMLDGTTTGMVGALNKAGSGTLTLAPPLTGAMSFNGLITINNGAVQGSTATILGTKVNLTSSSATLIFNQPTAATYNGRINETADLGNLTKTGAGNLTLTPGGAGNNYVGTTHVINGVLTAGNGDALPTNGTFIIDAGATLNINSFPTTMISLTGAGDVLLGTATLIVGNTVTETFSGDISGTGAAGFTKTSAGTLILSGNNSYPGTTTVNNGTLQAGSSTAFPNPVGGQVFVVNGLGTLDINSTGSGMSALTMSELTGAGNILLGSATLTLNNAAGPFSGNISGTGGSLVKEGASTFTLSGTNTYTGSTTVNGGTLFSGSAGAFPSGTAYIVNSPGNLNLNGNSLLMSSLTGSGNVMLGSATLTIQNVILDTFAGTISGTGGSLTKNGVGTLVLSGANTYTGTTTVNSGTLRADNTMAFPNPVGGQPFIVNSGGTLDVNSTGSGMTALTMSSLTGSGNVLLGNVAPTTLTIDNVGSDTFGGNISGSMGSLVKDGGGTLFLTGTNTYGVSTSILAGTLQGNTNSIPSVPLSMSAGTTLNFNQNFPGTFSANITGGAGTTLQMIGTSILNLTGTSTVTDTNILSGQLNVLNSLTSDVTVSSGAILGGTGPITTTPITGFVNVNGIVAPGNASVTLNVVNGPFNFNSGSTYITNVSPSSANLINVSGLPGNVTIAGNTTLTVGFESGVFTSRDYTIVHGTLRTGQFTNLVPSPFPRFDYQVRYTPQDVILSLTVNPFCTITTSGNAGAVACAFDTLNTNNSDVAELVAFLNFASTSQLQCDFDQMHSARMNAIPIVQETATTAVRRTLTDRLREIHGAPCERELFTEEKSRGFWFTPIANFSKESNRSQHGQCDQTKVGYNANTYGVTFGYNTAFNDHFVVGGALSYAQSSLHWKQGLGQSLANCGFASLFASAFNNILYVDAALIGAYDYYDVKRKIHLVNEFSTINRTAKHFNHAGEVDGHMGAGLTWNKEPDEEGACWQFGPYLDVDYIYLYETGYHEHGAKSIDLVVQGKRSDLLREEAGLQLSKWHVKSYLEWSEEMHLSYVHESRFQGKKSRERFVNSSDEFTVSGSLPDRDLVAAGAGLSFFMPKTNTMLSLRYEGEFGNKWKTQTGSLEFLWSF